MVHLFLILTIYNEHGCQEKNREQFFFFFFFSFSKNEMRKCVYTFKAINITNIHSIYNDIHIHASIQHGNVADTKLFLIKNLLSEKDGNFLCYI